MDTQVSLYQIELSWPDNDIEHLPNLTYYEDLSAILQDNGVDMAITLFPSTFLVSHIFFSNVNMPSTCCVFISVTLSFMCQL